MNTPNLDRVVKIEYDTVHCNAQQLELWQMDLGSPERIAQSEAAARELAALQSENARLRTTLRDISEGTDDNFAQDRADEALQA